MPIVIAIFTNMWLKNNTLKPSAIIRPNSSIARHEVRKQREIKIKYSKTIKMLPENPVSSAITQNIKSVGLVAGFDDFKSDICLSEIGFY